MTEKTTEFTTLLKKTNLAQFPLPAKVLVTALILVMGTAMLGAMGQVTIHDIIPTFFGNQSVSMDHGRTMVESTVSKMPKDDLLGDLLEEEMSPPSQPFHKTEEFIWLLKWSHIHLFGMNMIFIFMGVVALFLNSTLKTRAWLIGLPFVGVLIDILAMWLKVYVSPAFFWLHLPGGGLFGVIFCWVALQGLKEMWFVQKG